MSDEQRKRVFITGTYDLQDPRSSVAEAIRRAGGTPVIVEPWEPSSFIGRKVLRSDLVLMAIGHRYGSPSTASTKPRRTCPDRPSKSVSIPPPAAKAYF